MRVQICVRTIGSVAINVGKRRLGPSSGRLFTLLFYLASRREHLTSRRVVQELLYPHSENGRGTHSLRQLLYRLRRIGVPLETDSDQLSLRECDVTVDWWRFTEGGDIGATELEQLSQGLFPGYSPAESEGFREWFEAERADITRRLTRRLTKELPHYRAGGRWDLLDGAARVLLALDPLSEEGTLARAEALASSGRKSAALTVLDTYMAELGETQPNLRIAPAALRRRISERLPEGGLRSADEGVFLGRESMMRMLTTLAAKTRGNVQQVLVTWGEPGIGKTRLLSEYRSLAALQGGSTMLLSCQPHDVFRPLGMACDLAAQLLDVPGALGCDPSARALLTRLVNSNTQVGTDREARLEDTPLSVIVRCLDDLISAVATESPVVVLIDDAQWLDPNSLQVLRGVFARRANRPSCLILASRERTAFTAGEDTSEVVYFARLNPLDGEASLALTRRLLRLSPDLDTQRIESQICHQARGNPFAIRLLCAHFVATRSAESLSETIAEILRRRVRQLAVETRRTLEACVILSKNCTFFRLEQLLRTPRQRILQAIEHLDDCGLIEVSDGFIVSSHALLAEAVMTQMAPSVLKVLHAATAELLQHELIRPHSGRLPWDCAEHWRSAGNNAEAISVLLECSRRALDVGRPTDAEATIKRALTLESSDETRLELLQLALLAAWKAFEFQDVHDLMNELCVIRSRLGLPSHTHDPSEILAFAGILHSEEDPRGIIGKLIGCLTANDSNDEHKVMAAWQLFMLADLNKDAELAEFAFKAVEGRSGGAFFDRRHADLVYHTCFGETSEAYRLASSLRDTCQDVSPHSVGYLLNCGYAYYRTGMFREAHETLVRAFESARSLNLKNGEIHSALFLTHLCWSAEQYDDARGWHQILASLVAEHELPGVMWEYHLSAARIAIHDGELEVARERIDLARRSPQSLMRWPRMQILACAINLAYESTPTACSDEDIAHLCELHDRAQGLGGQDEIVLSLLRGLSSRGHIADAIALIERYRISRRESAAMRADLANFCVDLYSRASAASRDRLDHSLSITPEDVGWQDCKCEAPPGAHSGGAQ